MPVRPTYPGVYVEEVPSGVRTITGVATAITAFVGRTYRGPVDEPVRMQSQADYERVFGGLWLQSPLSYSVQHFFQNGGTDAIVVRCYRNPSEAEVDSGAAANGVATFALGARVVAAQGTLTLPTNPVDGETVTIGDVSYTFRDTLSDPATANEIHLGSETTAPATTRANIVAAINGTGTPGTEHSEGTVANPQVEAALAPTGNAVVLTARAPGEAGNAIVTASTLTGTGNGFDDATLGTTRAGREPTDAVAAQGTLTIGANPSAADPADQMTIGTVTYTFRDTLSAPAVANEIQLGSGAGGLATTRANIVAAINGTGTPGTEYSEGTVANPDVQAADAFAGPDLVLTARTTGTTGNDIETTETFSAAGNSFDGDTLGSTTAGTDPASLTLAAANPGEWGNNLRATVDHEVAVPADTDTFNLTVEEIDPTLPPGAPPARSETFRNVSIDPDAPLYVDLVLRSRSVLVRVAQGPTYPPAATTAAALSGGHDGQDLRDDEVATGQGLQSGKRGLFALENADLFNLLCIPPLTPDTDVGSGTRDAALQYCKQRRAFYIVDPPRDWVFVDDAVAGVDALGLRDENAAVYFPRVRMLDPLRDNQLQTFVPSGVMAGVYARTDAQRGVWKAPAGTDAGLVGVRELELPLTDGENGQLNPLGVNALRAFPVVGNVAWGARTLEGADQLASEWKYVPVRRTALFIEESLYRGLKWVVFEPNDEPLWAQIRLNVGSFMHTLFRQGAFQGATPRQAYLVKCDKETTTAADIDRGVVNILVGFAPLKPAEFVFVRIQQLAGQLQS
jgi:phage tail sheath protein FI